MALSDPSGHRTTQAKYNLAKAVFVNQLYSKAEPVLRELIDTNREVEILAEADNEDAGFLLFEPSHVR